MKGTDAFKTAIQEYLMFRANTEPTFAQTYQKPNKNIDDCVSYIINEVKKSGKNGFADDEIFGMAVHYYDEDSIVVDKKEHSGNIVINQKHDASRKDKEPEAKPKAEPKKPEAKMKVAKSVEKKAEPIEPIIPAPTPDNADNAPKWVEQTLF